MDQLRGLAIILVLLQHTYTVPTGMGLPAFGSIGEFNDLLRPYRQPLLMFLSGMLLAHSLRKPWKEYAEGKARKILWPMLVWTVPIVILRPPRTLTDVIAPSHLWFLLVLLACYAIGPLTRKIHPGVLAGVFLAGALFLPLDAEPFTSFYHLGMLLKFVPFFMLGAAATELTPRWQRAPWWAGVGTGVLGVATLLVSTANGWSHELIDFTASTLGIAVVLWAAPRIPLNRALVAVGERSIVWYVAHVPMMIVTAAVLWRIDPELPGVTTAFVVLVVAVVGCWMLDRFRVFGVLFEFPRLRERAPIA